MRKVFDWWKVHRHESTGGQLWSLWNSPGQRGGSKFGGGWQVAFLDQVYWYISNRLRISRLSSSTFLNFLLLRNNPFSSQWCCVARSEANYSFWASEISASLSQNRVSTSYGHSLGVIRCRLLLSNSKISSAMPAGVVASTVRDKREKDIGNLVFVK